MEIKFYRTYSSDVMDGRTLEVREFDSEELARKDAVLDTCNDSFSLYLVTLSLNDEVVEKEELIERDLECGVDIINRKRRSGENVSIGSMTAYYKFYDELDVPERIESYYRISIVRPEGPPVEKHYFETIEAAEAYALKDNWNCGITLYRVDLHFKGKITREFVKIRELKTAADERRRR